LPAMKHPILFRPSEYRDLSPAERDLLETGYQKALEALRKNITPKGFSACSLTDNEVYGTDVNYRSVWARDGAMTIVWTLDIPDQQIRDCQAATLRTLLAQQTASGQIPANVRIDSDVPEYAGVGGIASMDSALWVVIALWRHANETNDWSIVQDHFPKLRRTMDWLLAHDSNNCGLLEIPEAGDWTDLFARSYHVLYDEVLWYRCLVCYANILARFGMGEEAEEFRVRSRHVRTMILTNFWPSTNPSPEGGPRAFSMAQDRLGDARYLVAQLSPFGFSWRCDVLANTLAYLMYDLISTRQAIMTFRFLWGVGANEPGPCRNLYPPVFAGDPEWREYFTVNLLNLPNHYHNGGIWPFIGGVWVRFIHKLGLVDVARREMVKLAKLCAMGMEHDWEFNEWHHGVTGRPMGKAYQAWSAASFIQACHDLHLEPSSVDHHE